MTLSQWFNQDQGTAVTVPGAGAGNQGQCATAMDSALHDVYGLPYIYTPAAMDWWYKADNLGLTENFEKIPVGSPIQVGDFVVWKPLSVTDVQGHVDICSRAGTPQDFWCYDSNWQASVYHNSQGYPILHEVHHNDGFNSKIIGYLRRKGGDMITQDMLNSLIPAYFERLPVPGDLEFVGQDVLQTLAVFDELPEHLAVIARRKVSQASLNSMISVWFGRRAVPGDSIYVGEYYPDLIKQFDALPEHVAYAAKVATALGTK